MVTVNEAATPPSNNPNLQNLTVSGDATLSPAFNVDSTRYKLLLPCGDSSVTFTATPPVGGSVTYSTDSSTLTLLQPSTKTVVIRSATADSAASKEYRVDVIRRFPASIIRQYWESVLAVNLNREENGGYYFTAFQWQRNGEDIDGATSEYLHLTAPFTTDRYGVALTIRGQTIPACPLQFVPIQKVNIAGIRAYPNPVRNRQFTLENGQFAEGVNIAIYNLSGTLMRTDRVSGGATTVVNLTDIPVGIYVVRVGEQSTIIVIEK
jgi:hypothetical protein